MSVERAARGEHDRRGAGAAISSDQPDREQCQRRVSACSSGARLARWATKRAPGAARSIAWPIAAGSASGRQVDVDQRRHRQIGLDAGRAEPALERPPQILGRTCSTRVTPGAARAAAIAAGALAAPSAIWIE